MQQPQVQQQFVPQQSGVTVITQAPPRRNKNKLQPSALTQMRGLSIVQVVMGTLCLIFGIVNTTLYPSGYVSGVGFIGYGIWGGIYFVVVGGIGLGAARSNTTCWVVSAMVLNIICSAAFFLPIITITAIGLAITNSDYCGYGYGYGYGSSYYCGYHSVEKASLAMNSMILIMVIAELIITIWSAVLCCGAVCSCCFSSQPGHVTQYNNAPMVQAQNQQMMFVGAPVSASYGVGYSVGGQVATVQQSQYSPYPVGVHQQPVGMYPAQQQAPQAPPSYYVQDQSTTQQPGHQPPPPTAYTNNPQQQQI